MGSRRPGYPPFYDDNPFGIYEKILSGKLDWPRHVELTAKDLVKRLLVQVMWWCQGRWKYLVA
jgi:hypothetical protein